MHKLLSRIDTIKDKEQVIKALYYEEGLNEEQRQEIEKLIDSLLCNEQAKEWFNEEWEIYNEMSILTPTEEQRPDRVIIKDKEAIVIDYKTGMQKQADNRQMNKYKELLKTMGYKNIKGYLWYLGENEIISV